MFEAMWQDLRYGVRALLAAREYALVAGLTLALGIGANTAIFSVVDGVLLEPLPYPQAERIVWLSEQNTRGGRMAVAWGNFVDWRAETTSFAGLAAYGNGSTTVLGLDQPRTAMVSSVSEDFWQVFQAAPLRGRLTVPGDHEEGAASVAVVSDAFWRNALGGGSLDGVTLEIRGSRAQVVGVATPGFDFPGTTEVWTAVRRGSQSLSRSSHNWDVVGRLAEGVTLPRAAAEVEALTLSLVAQSSDDPDFLAAGIFAMTLQDRLVGSSRRALFLLMGAAGLVLLVACTNLVSTLLARGEARARELAVRASLGASRNRIVRQLLTENLLLGLAGGVAGIGVAHLVVRGLKTLGPSSVPRLDQVALDGSVLVFTAGIAVLTVFLVGLLPARRLTRGHVGEALRAGSRGNAGHRRAGLWRLLVGGEVALALVLLAGSGLVVRSFRMLLAQDAGFQGDDVTTLTLSLSQVKYPEAADHADWHVRYTREVRAQPGVAAAGIMSTLPLQGFLPNARMELDGDLEKTAVGGYVLADAGAFQALDIPLLRGRLFNDGDGPDDAHVAVVSQSFADAYWPGQDPIGKSVTGGGMDELWDQGVFSEVVGVVGDVRFRDLASEPVPTVYFHYPQRPGRLRWGAQMVVEAAAGDAPGLTALLRTSLARMDPDVPPRIVPMAERMRDSLAPQRFTLVLLGGFAALSLILAAAGIYGVVSYQVARRRREMGIRIALGGEPAAVGAMVVRQSLGVVGAGLLAGGVGVFLAGGVLRSLLFGVEPTDPVALAAAGGLLAAAAFVASWVPARRGTRVDPMITMRAE
ncbi:MAG TPA: ABC transporter permease [Longimicrobiales bacterium]|nr:ABC transporter permease [Longimicrobiales bacterium]